MQIQKAARKVLREVFPRQVFSDRVIESLVRKLHRAEVLLPEPQAPSRIGKDLSTAVWKDGDAFVITRHDSGAITLTTSSETMTAVVARRLCISLYSALSYKKGD